MRIGICGGTFDPFHRGHLEPILAARAAMQWDRVLYIPAYVQPFKQHLETSSAYHRFAMTVLGTEDQEGLQVSPRELERGSISYTVETLQQLRSEQPQATLDWIIGDDHLGKLLEWKSLDTIFELANFAVLRRAHGAAVPATGGSPASLSAAEAASAPSSLRHRVTAARERPAHGAIAFAENALVPISSTEIRRRVGEGEPIDDLVPPRVSRYIQRNGLYRKGHT